MSHILTSKPVAYSEIDLTWMVGRTVTVDLPNPPLPWVFALGDDTRINVECVWRIRKDSRIACTSEEHLHQYGLPAPIDAPVEATRLLAGHCVKEAVLREGSADLVLEFSDHLVLEIIPIYRGYDSWLIIEPSGTWLIAKYGGRICRCDRPS